MFECRHQNFKVIFYCRKKFNPFPPRGKPISQIKNKAKDIKKARAIFPHAGFFPVFSEFMWQAYLINQAGA